MGVCTANYRASESSQGIEKKKLKRRHIQLNSADNYSYFGEFIVLHTSVWRDLKNTRSSQTFCKTANTVALIDNIHFCLAFATKN